MNGISPVVWRLLATVALAALVLSATACGQEDQSGNRVPRPVEDGVDVPRRAVGLLPTGATQFSVIDVEEVLGGDAPSEYGDQLEDQWSDALRDIGVRLDDVSTMVVATVDDDDLIILQGGFDFEDVRDELSDSGFEENDYRDFELWEDGEYRYCGSA